MLEKRNNQPVLKIEFNKMELEESSHSTIQALHELCVFMEGCFTIWQNHVDDLRDKYDCLNYFTINQITYLRSMIGAIVMDPKGYKDEIGFKRVKWLLFNLNKSTDKTLLQKVHKESEERLKQIEKDDSLANKYNSQEIEIIKKISTQQNYPQELVRRAIQECGIADEQKLLAYCLEQSLSLVSDDSLLISDKDGKAKDDATMDTITDTTSFKYKRQSQWNEFIKQQQRGVINNFLGVQQLAIVLEHLKAYNRDKVEPRRLPGYLTYKGHPNLIICPQSDQVAYTLSIYAQSPQCPLPTNDEVLYCTNETTSEEIESFLRVALKSNGDKIYTILNVDQLRYDDADHAEKFFNKFASTKNYNLVIICSAEKQGQSILASAFCKYKIKPIPTPTEDIRRYLKTKLQQEAKDIQPTAAKLEPEQLSVRLLFSKKSGCGKTLYVKNLLKVIKLN